MAYRSVFVREINIPDKPRNWNEASIYSGIDLGGPFVYSYFFTWIEENRIKTEPLNFGDAEGARLSKQQVLKFAEDYMQMENDQNAELEEGKSDAYEPDYFEQRKKELSSGYKQLEKKLKDDVKYMLVADYDG